MNTALDIIAASKRDAIIAALIATNLTSATSKTSKRDAIDMCKNDEYVANEVARVLADDDDAAIADDDMIADDVTTDDVDTRFDDMIAHVTDFRVLRDVENARRDVIADDVSRIVFTRANRDALSAAQLSIIADCVYVTTRIAFADCVARMCADDVAALDALVSHVDTRRSRVIVNADAAHMHEIATVLRNAARRVFAIDNSDTSDDAAIALENAQHIALRASHCDTLAHMISDEATRDIVFEHVANAANKRERSLRHIANTLA